MSDILDTALNFGEDALRGSIKRITVRSRLNDNWTVNMPFAKGPPPAPGTRSKSGAITPSAVLKFVQPAVYVEHPAGTLTWAPYGEPASADLYEWGIAGAALVGGLAAYGAWCFLFRK